MSAVGVSRPLYAAFEAAAACRLPPHRLRRFPPTDRRPSVSLLRPVRRTRPRGPAAALLAGALLAALLSPATHAAASPAAAPRAAADPPLTTPWTSQVSARNALPEYPRPQLTRDRWQNLNGSWQFAEATAGQAPP